MSEPSALEKIDAKIKQAEKLRDHAQGGLLNNNADKIRLNGEIYWMEWVKDLLRKDTASKLRAMVRGIGPVGTKEATILVNADAFNSLIGELERES